MSPRAPLPRTSMISVPRVWRGVVAVGLAAFVALVFGTSVDSYAQEKEEPAAETAPPSGDMVRFGHKLHQGKGVAVEDCQQCHGIKGFDIEPVTRGKNHQPCNNSGCHASEYMSREPKICVVCHDTNEPWIKQVARIRDLPTSEFGGEISHKTHQSDKASKGGIKCESCHGNVYAEGEKPEAHAVCGSCHQGGLRPLMSECGECHKLGYQAERLKSQSKYTVRARFRHDDHDRDPRNKSRETPGCKLCHSGVQNASTLSEIPRPTMQSCDACHDGVNAFKTTGFGCVKCHGATAE